MARSAVVAGATGLVGGFVLERLLAHADYVRVVALVRRPLRLSHDRLQTEIIDFERFASLPGPVDDVFCCLGTTIAKAGSQAAFRRVDHDHVVALAGAAGQAGARRFLMVSALGADPLSRIFYNRVKGE
ncbi:MAG: NAD(P)H-binding protein, partial [Burkholderiales bacterium]